MQNYFPIKQDGFEIKIFFSSVLFLKASGKQLRIFADNKEYVTRLSIRQFLRLANSDVSLFCQVHKSYAVQLNQIEMFNNHTVVVKGTLIPIGRQYKRKLLNILKPEIASSDNKGLTEIFPLYPIMGTGYIS